MSILEEFKRLEAHAWRTLLAEPCAYRSATYATAFANYLDYLRSHVVAHALISIVEMVERISHWPCEEPAQTSGCECAPCLCRRAMKGLETP